MTVYKYQGAGNDFILLDRTASEFDLSPDFVKKICDRRLGVGADGLIAFDSSARYDFSMQFFNSDGSGGMMCGNGGRCIIAFAAMKGVKPKDGLYTFEAPDGLHSGSVLESDGKKSLVRLKMNDVHKVSPFWDGLCMNTGCPHLVLPASSDIETMDVEWESRRWRYDSAFSPTGTNVNWIEVQGDRLRVRTFEKGVECETLACGTGVIAATIAAHIRFGESSPVFSKQEDRALKCRVRATGGDLEVELLPSAGNQYSDIWLTGGTELVFRAEL